VLIPCCFIEPVASFGCQCLDVTTRPGYTSDTISRRRASKSFPYLEFPLGKEINVDSMKRFASWLCRDVHYTRSLLLVAVVQITSLDVRGVGIVEDTLAQLCVGQPVFST
jgi:hypothetical protein